MIKAPSKSVAHYRAKVAALSPREPKPVDAEALIEAKRNLRAEMLAEHVARVVAELPPLTDQQCQRIAGLLIAGGGTSDA
jgi:hypothetical protein